MIIMPVFLWYNSFTIFYFCVMSVTNNLIPKQNYCFPQYCEWTFQDSAQPLRGEAHLLLQKLQEGTEETVTDPCVYVCVCVCVLSPFSCDRLWYPMWGSAIHGIFQQEYWSEFPCPSPGDLPNQGIEPASLTSPALAGRFFITSTI